MQETNRIKMYSYTDRITTNNVLQSIKMKTQEILYATLVEDYTYGDYVDSYTQLKLLED